jgi:2-C-methyl-D-erythritol 4-phosphate cytidylyltransferase
VKNTPFISAIVVGAGAGSRFDHELPKQFVKLGQKPVIVHSLEKFDGNKNIQEIIAVVPKKFREYFEEKIQQQYKLRKLRKVISGGKSRQESVQNGLEAIDRKAKYVLVHDAVRPLVTEQEIEKLIKAVQKYAAAILAVPVKDTLKEIRGGQITRTYPRERFWLAQTPQAFEVRLLKRAYLRAHKDSFAGTDCSSLVERLGVEVRIVPGNSRNIKITQKDDLLLAEKLLKK